MERHEVEQLRRSLAMSQTLTDAQVRTVLEELDRALARQQRVDVLVEELGRVFPEVRRILNELARAAGA